MGRPSKLTDVQWEQIGKRLLDNESAAALAREFGVSKASISTRFSKRIETVKTVANQIVDTNRSLSKLNVSEQIAALDYAARIQNLQDNLFGAAGYGAATAHRLAGIANMKAQEVDDAAPLTDESRKALSDISALTKMANEASQIGIDLMKANKDTIADVNKNDAAQRAGLNKASQKLSEDPMEASKEYQRIMGVV